MFAVCGGRSLIGDAPSLEETRQEVSIQRRGRICTSRSPLYVELTEIELAVAECFSLMRPFRFGPRGAGIRRLTSRQKIHAAFFIYVKPNRLRLLLLLLLLHV